MINSRVMTRIREIYTEYPRQFWVLIGALFIDRLGGALVSVAFAGRLYHLIELRLVHIAGMELIQVGASRRFLLFVVFHVVEGKTADRSLRLLRYVGIVEGRIADGEVHRPQRELEAVP